ncbi:hypothetical protein TrLO_g1419 [Triparma laevis f. longispina]|uniref:Uncharacterized protein n=1 Tax=Triparma laevis f. longispina TaxID=1714387 RepID=A0A9W7FNN6_9STRA|nr:hypothetical protein TrLO_g1419 [Triparma laevis f. longispina]
MSLLRFPIRLIQSYNILLQKHPTPVNFITGGTLGFVGDVICQVGLEGKKLDKSSSEFIDIRRSLSLSIFGSFYSGGICVRLYSLYPHLTPSFAKSRQLFKGMWASGMDNFIHVPFCYTPMFYFITDGIKGVSFEGSLGKLIIFTFGTHARSNFLTNYNSAS